VADVEQPREESSINSPQVEELGNNTNPPDYKDQLERLELPKADSKEVEANGAGGKPPGSPYSHAETTLKPMVIESPADSVVPAPDSKEVEIGKSAKASEQPQTVSRAVEVRRY
jgi:hypothetical protein